MRTSLQAHLPLLQKKLPAHEGWKIVHVLEELQIQAPGLGASMLVI